MIEHEADLAWALALAAKPHLNVVERNGVFVPIGAGETFAVVTALVKWLPSNGFSLNRIWCGSVSRGWTATSDTRTSGTYVA